MYELIWLLHDTLVDLKLARLQSPERTIRFPTVSTCNSEKILSLL